MALYLKQVQPAVEDRSQEISERVFSILQEIRRQPERAIRHYSREFDNWNPESFRVSESQIDHAKKSLPETVIQDILYAQDKIRRFAQAQLETLQELELELETGVILGHKHIPVSAVGAYVPGGRYPLVASAHMSIIPAKVAGVERVVACSPPVKGKGIYPATLFAIHAAGADEIYCLGGVQALGAMAYGFSEMRPVDMIVGPGNAYVAEAKKQLFGHVGVDLLAGPTEILIIADESADPEVVACDLLGQAEHGPTSRAILITTSQLLGEAVLEKIEVVLKDLPTADIAGVAWKNYGEVIVASSREEAAKIADEYAPEHLELQTSDNDWFFVVLRNYGSLFIGEEVTVAHSDKVLGPNHILPTNRAARYTGGLWVGKFLKTVTYQKITREASLRIGPTGARLCRLEGMLAHEHTILKRLEKYA